jgi:hypothetical protein
MIWQSYRDSHPDVNVLFLDFLNWKLIKTSFLFLLFCFCFWLPSLWHFAIATQNRLIHYNVLWTASFLSLSFFLSFFFFGVYFLLDIFFIYISNVTPFLVSLPPGNTLSHSPSPCFYEGVPPPALDSPTLGHLSSLHRTKDMSSHWCLTRLSSYTYASGAMCTPLLMALSLGILGESGWLILLFFLWSCKPLQLLQSSLTPLLGTLHSVQWLARNICLCICKALAGPLRIQPYQALFSMHFLTSTIVSRFGNCIRDESPGGKVSGWLFFQSLLNTLSPSLLSWVFCSLSEKDRSTHTLVFLLIELHVEKSGIQGHT